MRNITIYLFVPVHNRCAITKRFAAQLQVQTNTDFQLVLLDDGSNDGTAESIRRMLGSKVTIVSGRGDWWWGGALQVAYELVKGGTLPCKDSDIIGIMNDDSLFECDTLERVYKAFLESQDKICLLASAINNLTRQHYVGASVKWLPFRILPTGDVASADCAPTRAIFMRVADFKMSGGFWPQRIPHHCADYEFTYRIKRQGLRFICPQDLAIEFTDSESRAVPIRGSTLGDRVSQLFSLKCDYNPKPWSWFIIRHARPRLVIPLALAQIWLRAAVRVVTRK